jgi:hypothetical protein
MSPETMTASFMTILLFTNVPFWLAITKLPAITPPSIVIPELA